MLIQEGQVTRSISNLALHLHRSTHSIKIKSSSDTEKLPDIVPSFH
jgi:hypothetical protein